MQVLHTEFKAVYVHTKFYVSDDSLIQMFTSLDMPAMIMLFSFWIGLPETDSFENSIDVYLPMSKLPVLMFVKHKAKRRNLYYFYSSISDS